MTVFNKYINNKTKPFKKKSYYISESGISQSSVNSYINNNYYIINSHNNLNKRINNRDLLDSKRSNDDIINNSKMKNKNRSNKNNINISQNSFLNHTFSSLIKKNKIYFNKINNKKFKKNNTHNVINNSNKFSLKSKILKNKNKNDSKRISFLKSKSKIKNMGEK